MMAALHGPAADVIRSMAAEDDIDDILVKLQDRFGDKMSKTAYKAELAARRRRHDESITAYASDIDQLTRLAHEGLPEEAINDVAIGAFVNGITEADICTAIETSEKTRYWEIITVAVRVEKSRRRCRTQREIREVREVCEIRRANNGDRRPIVTCHNCGKK